MARRVGKPESTRRETEERRSQKGGNPRGRTKNNGDVCEPLQGPLREFASVIVEYRELDQGDPGSPE